jgi:hypothetical protein
MQTLHDTFLFLAGAAGAAQDAPPQQFLVRKPTSAFMALNSAE